MKHIAKIYRWYDKQGRKTLPWRLTPDPYAIWVSEIMLQQTQVKTVLERYYTPFLHQFPTIKALAAANEQDVLKAWEGLGYYSRARNLYKAARQIAESAALSALFARGNRGADGDIIQALLTLPGIGRNTAHAIAAFAFGVQVPVMEANVKRILCRVFALENPSAALLWDKAHELMGRADPFIYNQAMMDIGALVCTKKAPHCAACPLAAECRGKAAPQLYPAARSKATVPVRRRDIVVLKGLQDRYYIVPRRTAFLGGLYGFLEFEPGASPQVEGTRYTRKSLTPLGSISQSYSHFTLEAEVFFATAKAPKTPGDWKTLPEIKSLPLSKADHKILALLEGRSSY